MTARVVRSWILAVACGAAAAVAVVAVLSLLPHQIDPLRPERAHASAGVFASAAEAKLDAELASADRTGRCGTRTAPRWCFTNLPISMVPWLVDWRSRFVHQRETYAALAALPGTRLVRTSYRSWRGRLRELDILVPTGWTPNQPARLVVGLHARCGSPWFAAAAWGSAPAYTHAVFAFPAGDGRVLGTCTWGDTRNAGDVAAMPAIVRAALTRRLGYAVPAWRSTALVGVSQGGTDTLITAGLHPKSYGRFVAVDPVVDLAARYREYLSLGARIWAARMVREVGGTPAQAPAAWRARSALSYTAVYGRMRSRLFLVWSRHDDVVLRQDAYMTRFTLSLQRSLSPVARITERVGGWHHAFVYNQRSWALFGMLGLRPLRLHLPGWHAFALTRRTPLPL